MDGPERYYMYIDLYRNDGIHKRANVYLSTRFITRSGTLQYVQKIPGIPNIRQQKG